MSLEQKFDQLSATLERMTVALERIASGVEPCNAETTHVIEVKQESAQAAAEPATEQSAAASAPAPAQVEQPQPSAVDLDVLRKRCEQLSMNGMRDQLIAALGELGAKRLQDLPAEKLPVMAQKLDALEQAA